MGTVHCRFLVTNIHNDMTERKIILTAVACEVKQIGEDFYNAININDEKAIGKAIFDLRNASLVAQLANSNLLTAEMKKKYLSNNAQN
jgi:hypothetical protein